MWNPSINTFLNTAAQHETEYMVAPNKINSNLKYIYIVITECVSYSMRFTSALHLSKKMKYCPMLVQWWGNVSKTALFGSIMSALWEKIFSLGVSAITRLYFKLRNQLHCPTTQRVLYSLKICNYCLPYPFKSITHMIIINYDAAQYVWLKKKKTWFNTTQAMYYITHIFSLYSDRLGIHF